MPHLAPAFGGGFFEGTMGICSAWVWLNNSLSDDDGEADNGESSGG